MVGSLGNLRLVSTPNIKREKLSGIVVVALRAYSPMGASLSRAIALILLFCQSCVVWSYGVPFRSASARQSKSLSAVCLYVLLKAFPLVSFRANGNKYYRKFGVDLPPYLRYTSE